MRFITSFNQALYDAYAWRLMQTKHNLPGELIVYSEDYPGIDLYTACPKLLRFKDAMAGYRPQNFRNDVVKFSNKVFAMIHALGETKETLVWLDADIVMHKAIPEEFLESLIKPTSYCGHFYRTARHAEYTETGFLIFRPRHAENEFFRKRWEDVYLKGEIFKLPQWHDCMAFDEARKNFAGFVNLSGEHIDQMHPIVMGPLGKYLDHCKGPRKYEGYSVENPSRWWETRPVRRSAILGDGERRDTGVVA